MTHAKPHFKPYEAPSGGWGSVRSLGDILTREGVPVSGALTLTRQNKVDGFQCVGCAWVKPAKPDLDMPDVGHDSFRLMTLRSNDQFNTTVYGYNDRFHGIRGTRLVVLMNQADIDRLGLRVGATVTLKTAAKDGIERVRPGLTVVAYDIPIGCLGGYYPECNVLLPLWHVAEGSKLPAAKSIPVTVHPESRHVVVPAMAAETA